MRPAERGAQLTNQLLAFSRRHEIITEPVDVNQVISDACEMLPRTIGPTIEIESALAGNDWWALCEPGQLELAILNLARAANWQLQPRIFLAERTVVFRRSIPATM
jgi:signal transduction histidine kinase